MLEDGVHMMFNEIFFPKITLSSSLLKSLILDPSFISLHHCQFPSFILLKFCCDLTAPNFLQYYLPHNNPFLATPPPSSFPPSPIESFIGFNFDLSNCDYKVVRISYVFDDERFGLSTSKRSLHGIAHVYYVAENAPYDFDNRLVHWIAKCCTSDGLYYYFVLSFDFADELFREVVSLESVAHASSIGVMVSVVGGGNGKAFTVYHVKILFNQP
ncbi:hypothetical protein E2542_SST28067 [Spatholobus suberectus]|nr:hypothetical protein E2542_SST28067 [Spatholobus suberectus]